MTIETMNSKYLISRDKCPGCESGKIINLVSLPYDAPEIREYLTTFYASTGGVDYEYLESANFAIGKCLECTLVFQREIPGKELSQILYDRWIDKSLTRERQKNKDLNYFLCLAQEIASIIEHFGKTPRSLHFLDFGMGWGNWCRMAKGFGVKVDGTELSQDRIVAARECGIENVGIEELSAREYDFINADRVFEHLPEPLETLKVLVAGLRSGGIVKINVPDGSGIEKAISAWDWSASRDSELSLNPIAPLEHINCYNKKALAKMASCAGLEAVNLRKSQSVKPPTATCWAQNQTATAEHWGDTCVFFGKK